MLNPQTGTTWGTDPEAFFAKGNKIVMGSERFVPEEGLKVDHFGEITRDGVQFELHPAPNLRLSKLVENMGQLLKRSHLLADFHGVHVLYDGLVTVTRKELNSLSPGSRVLGCMPSENFWGVKPIDVDPVKYRKRSAGGHVHFGLRAGLLGERTKLAPLNDILTGNTCVLLDRDPGAVERRQNYGRAGEFRQPSYGFEYRTTSNFWLRDPYLMYLVFGMCNIAASVLTAKMNGDNTPWVDLQNCVNVKKIIKAINTNDFDLALGNFKALYPFFQKHVNSAAFAITSSNFENFMEYAAHINNSGVPYSTHDLIKKWQGK